MSRTESSGGDGFTSEITHPKSDAESRQDRVGEPRDMMANVGSTPADTKLDEEVIIRRQKKAKPFLQKIQKDLHDAKKMIEEIGRLTGGNVDSALEELWRDIQKNEKRTGEMEAMKMENNELKERIRTSEEERKRYDAIEALAMTFKRGLTDLGR